MHPTTVHIYEYSCNTKQAILLDLKEAIPSELAAELQDDDDLQASFKLIIFHMEKHYNTLKPCDITKVLADFKTSLMMAP